MKYPGYRMRRLRKSVNMRRMMRETVLSLPDVIMPCFVIEGRNKKTPVLAMPGIYRYSADLLLKELESIYASGITAVLLFGVPEKGLAGKKLYKGQVFPGLCEDNGLVQSAVRKIKKELPGLVVITDVCMCGYTSHGHCGIIEADGKTAVVSNDETIRILAKTALSHARAGADIVAPSAMMDGQVAAIRKALDAHAYPDTAILSYSTKFSSGFYGPFREAAGSAPRSGDRKSYQLDYHNAGEALRETGQDILEGADILMVKPALAYLDIIRGIKEKFNMPVAAYNVSGEYSMVKAAAANGWISEPAAALEMLTAMKRAGADIIITYWARELVKWLKM